MLEEKVSYRYPNRNIEPAVATTLGTEYLNKQIKIHHTPEIKGGLKALQQKGLKITDYKENIPKPWTKR